MNVRLGIGRPEEAELMAEMSRRLVEYGLRWSWHAERIARALRNPECVVLAARDGRRMVGFAIMEFHDEHAHLCLLAVLPSYQKRGIGKRLIEWLELSARTAGIFWVELELRAGNEAAKRFYSRLGYSVTGTRRAYYAPAEDALCMGRDLKVIPAAPA
jgi:ribosomal-protein-alanine N-acetyltransferase